MDMTRKMTAMFMLRKLYILNQHEEFRGDYDDEIRKLEEELRNDVDDKEYD